MLTVEVKRLMYNRHKLLSCKRTPVFVGTGTQFKYRQTAFRVLVTPRIAWVLLELALLFTRGYTKDTLVP